MVCIHRCCSQYGPCKSCHGDGGRSGAGGIQPEDYIVHTHAKDGRRNYYRAPEEVYGLVEAEMLASPSFTELPLGTGNVDFAAYLKALDEIGYHGFLTVEREVGDTPEKDIRTAVEFLQKLIH